METQIKRKICDVHLQSQSNHNPTGELGLKSDRLKKPQTRRATVGKVHSIQSIVIMASI